MPTATLTQFAASSISQLVDYELPLSELVSGDATSAVLQGPSSSIQINVSGTGFAYDGTSVYDAGESLTAGTINQFEFWEDGTLLLRITSLSISAVALQSALEDIAANNDYTAYYAIIDSYAINYDGTAVPFGDEIDVNGSDFADTFTLTGGGADYYIRPGDGVDTIIAGTSASWVQISYVNYSVGGITVNWGAGTITDPWGNTDTFTGRVNAIRGTEFADTVTGDNGDNTFRGLAGNDVFDGGDGFDEMRYDRDANYGGTNGVTVNLATGVATDGFGDTDVLSNVESVRGTNFADNLTGDGNNNRLYGLGGNDTLNGGGGDDQFDGGDGNDTINTGSGNNYVNGSTGDDTINVGTSADINIGYHDMDAGITVQVTSTGATVDKGVNGTDTVTGFDNIDYDVGSNGFDGTSSADVFTINGLAFQWTGVAGREGNDTISNAGAGFVRADYREDGNNAGSGITYTSNNGSRVSGTVTGAGTGTDTLSNVNELRGTDFDDVFNGGDGDERFILRGGNDTVNGGGGHDVVRFDRSGMGAVTVDLGAGIATGTFNGNAFSHTLSGIEEVRGSRDYADQIIGSGGAETFYGGGGNDTLNGRGGADELYGEDGNDVLVGGAGADRMVGGVGNDAYFVDNIGDATVEVDGEGIDTVNSSIGFSLRSQNQFLENLVLTGNSDIAGVGNALGNKITGNSGNNTLNGASGNDWLIGGAGNDTFRDDAGGDQMEGGTGNDVYYVDSFGDKTIELYDQGLDTVVSSVSFSLRYQNQHLENLILSGSDNLVGIGNSLGNKISGNSGNNTLNGATGNDWLIGGAGNDTFRDDGGGDQMEGGAGDDVYYVDSFGDKTIETYNQGYDIVASSISFSLRYQNQHLEKLVLTGNGDLVGIGNALDNIIVGNSGNNTLNGATGNDRLIGGEGDDILRDEAGNDIFTGGAGADAFVLSLVARVTL